MTEVKLASEKLNNAEGRKKLVWFRFKMHLMQFPRLYWTDMTTDTVRHTVWWMYGGHRDTKAHSLVLVI